MNTKYVKIETPYLRDNKTKKMLEGEFRNEAVAFLKDAQWECTEKIDGTNVGIVWDGHRVSLQGHNPKAQLPCELVNWLIRTFCGESNEELFEQKFGAMPVVLFGEGYGGKIQKVGKQYRSDLSFILFDVYLPAQNMWLKRESVNNIAEYFNIDSVPVILTGTLDEAVAFVKEKPLSTIGTAPMEGLVCRPLVELKTREGERIMVKVKVRDFTEK